MKGQKYCFELFMIEKFIACVKFCNLGILNLGEITVKLLVGLIMIVDKTVA